MQKKARKPSTDPVQEKLRENKALWNKDVTTFINDLIHLKKTMNGWPSKFHMQRSKIQEPIPADPATIIGSLAGDFQDLAQKGKSIVEQQLDYSKKRRKKQPKQLNLPFGSSPAQSNPPAPDLSNQLSLNLSHYEQKYNLIAEGSNFLTRFFARLLNPGIGGSVEASVRKLRMSLLTAAVESYKDLEKLQGNILKSSPESIFVSGKLLSKIENNWHFIMQGFFTFKNELPQGVSNSGGEIKAPEKSNKKSDEKADEPVESGKDNGEPQITNEDLKLVNKYNNDFLKYAPNFLDINVKPMNMLIKQFTKLNDNEKMSLVPQIISAYKALIDEVNAKNSTSGNSLEEIWKNKNSKKAASFAHMELQVFAQNVLSKWFGKIKHQLSQLDKTSSFRLKIFKLAEDNMELIDQIMNSLEKEMNVATLEPLISTVTNNNISIRELIRALEITTKGQEFNRPYIDLLERGKITDRSIDMTPTERAQLEKMLDTRRLRQLTNMYGK